MSPDTAPDLPGDLDALVAAVRKATYQNRGILRRNLPRHLAALRGAGEATPALDAALAAVLARTNELLGFLDNSGFMAGAGNKKLVQAQRLALTALDDLRPLLLAPPPGDAGGSPA